MAVPGVEDTTTLLLQGHAVLYFLLQAWPPSIDYKPCEFRPPPRDPRRHIPSASSLHTYDPRILSPGLCGGVTIFWSKTPLFFSRGDRWSSPLPGAEQIAGTVPSLCLFHQRLDSSLTQPHSTGSGRRFRFGVGCLSIDFRF